MLESPNQIHIWPAFLEFILSNILQIWTWYSPGNLNWVAGECKCHDAYVILQHRYCMVWVLHIQFSAKYNIIHSSPRKVRHAAFLWPCDLINVPSWLLQYCAKLFLTLERVRKHLGLSNYQYKSQYMHRKFINDFCICVHNLMSGQHIGL